MTAPAPTHYNPPQIAAMLQVDVRLVLDWIHRGELDALDVARRGSRRRTWRVAADDLQSFLDGRKIKPQATKPQGRQRRRPQRHAIKEFV